MLCAASIILGFTSRRLVSTNRATKGKAANTRGMMVATVPTDVPTISLDRGITMIIRIRKGMERNRLMSILRKDISHLGKGRIPFLSPTTSKTPKGRPKIREKTVDRMVT